MKPTIWKNCYSEQWAGILIPPAFAHPAKISLALVKKIFAHALELGWIRKGDTCVDPFAGVGGVAFGAIARGINFIGQELEPHFVDFSNGVECTGISKADWVQFYGRWEKANRRDGRHWCPNCLAQAKQVVEPAVRTKDLFDLLGTALYERNIGKIPSTLPHRFEGNLEFWERKFGLSGAVIVQGDSRKLLENLRERVECVVSSPPFLTGDRASAQRIEFRDDRSAQRMKENQRWRTGYGSSKGQLGNLPAGNVDALVSSPPYAGNEKSDYNFSNDGKMRRRDEERGYRQGAGCFRGSETYGQSEGQLGAMRDKDFDLVVSSPPYVKSVHGGNGIDASKLTGNNRAGPNSQVFAEGYGESPAQLAAMSEGCFDIAVSSPPFENQIAQQDRKFKMPHDSTGNINVDYGSTENQLGNSTGETFWTAAREIVQQCFLALKPGGHAIWVVKDFLRNGRRVEFCEQWRLLCEKVGFKTICIHRAMLTTEIYGQHTIYGDIEKKTRKRSSFFRNLAEINAKAKIYWENVSNDEKKKWVERVRTKLSKRDENYILQRARLEAYKAAGSPDIELDSIIDWEIVLCMVKPAQTFERIFIDGANGATKLKTETVEV